MNEEKKVAEKKDDVIVNEEKKVEKSAEKKDDVKVIEEKKAEKI